MTNVKNLGYDTWLLYKQRHQESGLCCFCLRVIRRSVFMELCVKTQYLCPSEGHKHGDRQVTETFVIKVLPLKRKIVALEFWHKEYFF